jgi:hypothetical protein
VFPGDHHPCLALPPSDVREAVISTASLTFGILISAKRPKSLIESVVYAIGRLYVALDAFHPEKLRVIFPPRVGAGAVTFQPHGTIVATVVTATNYHGRPDNFHATLVAPNLVQASSHFLPPMAHTTNFILSST